MILPIPAEIGFFFVAVPVWELEPQPSAQPPAEAGAECGDKDDADAQDPQSMARWVFKGYEWRPFPNWHPFVNPAWDRWVENDPSEVHDRELRQEQDRQQERQAAQARASRRAEPPNSTDWPAPPFPGPRGVER